MQVFILGMHRSGTSALARVLNLMGLYFGGENVSTGRSSENVKGFWERRDVRDLNDAILAAADSDWDVVSNLDLDGLPPESKAGYVSAAEDIVLNLDAHRPWFVKEPRLCVLFPIWYQALESPFVIHIHRNPLEVARSLERRNGIPIPAGLALWEYYNIRALQATEGVPRHFMGYEDLLRTPDPALQSLSDFLTHDGDYTLRRPSRRELSSFLDPDLHHQQAAASDLAACATPSQLELYEFLKGAAANTPPHEPPPDCLATLRAHESGVDLGDRARRTEHNRERRTERNLELQLAIRAVELRQAVTAKDDAVVQRNALTRKLERSQDQRSKLTANLAVANERVAVLRKQQKHQERQVADLRKTGEQLELQRDLLQRDVATARERFEQASQARDELRRANAELRRANAELRHVKQELQREGEGLRHAGEELRRERDGLNAQRLALRKHKEDSASAHASTRTEMMALIRQWDAEIARRKVQSVELDEFIGQLSAGTRAWLGSRRWRLGDALVTLPRRLTFRRTGASIRALLQTSLDAHEANKATVRQAAKSDVRLLDDMPSATAVAAKIDNEAVRAESTRAATLNAMLFDRARALGRLADDLAERRRFAEELTRLIETVRSSRRWRIGHFLLSLPRLALGRVRPETAADALSGLIAEYRRAATPEPVTRASESTSSAVQPEAPKPVEDPASAKPMPLAPPATMAAPLFPHPTAGDVDVVVCVHNALEHVERCLQSVLARTTVPYRLIVVNDGSDAVTTDRLREIAAKYDLITLIETGGPLGYTCAANRGLRASTAANVVLLNSDTIVPRLWLEEMLECMASSSTIGIVGPLSNAASWQSVPDRTGPDGRWAVNHLPPGYSVDEYAELLSLSSKRLFPKVDFVNGFCFMIKRSVIERIGFLDEDIFPRGYGEENDYCIRAQDAGFEMAIADHCFVYHAKSKSFGDATRDKLAQAGGEALERKHGKARIDASSDTLKESPMLAGIRATVRSLLDDSKTIGGRAPAGGALTGNHVLFVLPVRGGSGGANSVVQEAAGMRSLGVDAKVATHVKYLGEFERFYPEFLATGDHFLFYESDEDLARRAAPFEVVVATLWSTPALIAPVAARWPDKLYVYYVQDYEPLFFADDDPSRTIALDSYTLIPDMVLMAKTDWICRTVQERHNRPVYRIAPSLDHAVFYPGEPHAEGNAIKIAAMFRPTTPRRGPLRTIRVLKDVIANSHHPVEVLLFGCETQHVHTYIARNAPELRLTRHFDSRGVLPRQGVAELMREADIFVDLSDYQAFGRTGLEAMACGCAVVVPKEGGVYEYAVHGENCMVVDTKSDIEMSRAIQALAADATLRTRITKHAIETAARFDIVRASVSEISVFRAAMAARVGHVASEGHGRGIVPAHEPAYSVPLDANVSPAARRAKVPSARVVASAADRKPL